jgi:glycosyltransferase involved in cell wall biosynthesis
LYNLSDIFVLSSYAEGLPRVILEAMACNCIPIATDVGSVSAVITDGYNGFVTKPGDSLAISNCIKKIFSLPQEELELIGSRAREKIVQSFDCQKIWQDMVKSVTVQPI